MKRSHIVTLILVLIILVVLIFLISFLKYGPPVVGSENSTNGSLGNNTLVKVYIKNASDNCTVINFACIRGTHPFVDDLGCGCEPDQAPVVNETGRNYCPPPSGLGIACAEIYQPVCGWYNSNIQCLKYPCAETFSNSCFACSDSRTSYWTAGVCPSG